MSAKLEAEYAAEKAEADTLRARVRTLEGALRVLDKGIDDAGQDVYVRGDESARDVIHEALSGAQPDTALAKDGWDRAYEDRRALAEREASIVELRRALEDFIHVAGCSNGCAPDDMTCATNRAKAALAQPATQVALRAMLMDVGMRVIRNKETLEAIVDAVLKGES